jgi:hypothetical protein
MCRGTILCREDIENVPKKFNLTKATINFTIFWAHKELVKLQSVIADYKNHFKAEPIALVSATTL